MADINRTRGGIQTQLLDDNGEPLTSGTVTVRDSGTQQLMTLHTGPYSTGLATIPNPFNIEDYFGDGTLRFFIDPQPPRDSNRPFSINIEVNISGGVFPDKRIILLPVGSSDYFWVGTGEYDLMIRRDLDLRYKAKTTDNLSATVDPTVNDDSDDGYSVGSIWINTTSSPQEAFQCVDATVGAAVWVNTTLTIAELGSVALLDAGTASDQIRNNAQNDLVYNPLIQNNFAALADPDITNDSSEGYEIGSLWINTTSSPLEMFICIDDTVGAANWKVITIDNTQLGTMAYADIGTGDYQFRYNTENDETYQGIAVNSTVDPTVNDDISAGFSVGDTWINNAPTYDKFFVCTNNALGAAVWTQISYTTVESTSDPTVNDDSNDGFRVGSIWVNTASSPKAIFVCVDDTVGAAIWREFHETPTNVSVFYVDWTDETKIIEDGDSLWNDAVTASTASPSGNIVYDTRSVLTVSSIVTPSGYTLDNYSILSVEAQIYINSTWTGNDFIFATTAGGTKAHLVNNTSIVVQTGENSTFGVANRAKADGNASGNAVVSNSAPCRVRIACIL